MSSAPRHAGAPSAHPAGAPTLSPVQPVPGTRGEFAPGAMASSSGLTSRRHVDYGRVRSAICPA